MRTIGFETRGVSWIHKILNSISRLQMPELQTRTEEVSWFLKNKNNGSQEHALFQF